jgi:hypothetical protein
LAAPGGIKKAGHARHSSVIQVRCPGGAEHPTRAEELLLLRFLGLLRLLSLLRFLSHSILSGFNGLKRDTRGMLGGGPASQEPRLTTKQIRGALASHRHLSVIALSTVVCVLMRFLAKYAPLNVSSGAICGLRAVLVRQNWPPAAWLTPS